MAARIHAATSTRFLNSSRRERLRLIVRPGPIIGDQWRNGGLPDWLPGETGEKLALSSEQPNSQAASVAAQQSSPDRANMPEVRRWFINLAREVAPYSSRRVFLMQRPGPKGEPEQRKISGPLLFVALEDEEAIRAGAINRNEKDRDENASFLSSYLGELQAAMTRGGLNTIYFATAPHLAARGAASLSSTPAPGARTSVGLAGDWNWDAFSDPAGTKNSDSGFYEPYQPTFLAKSDATNLAFQALTLTTQTSFPPFLSGLSTTTFVPSDDVDVMQSAPQNLLLASRLWIGDGIRGIEYSPLQDTLTPAGWSAPSAARYYRWHAPLDLSGNRGPSARGVMRNGLLSFAWGAMLAASHLHADFGIVDLRTALADPAENRSAATRVSVPIEKIFRDAQVAGWIPELVNPGAQSVERLGRDGVLLLPVPAQGVNFPGLSETAQKTLVEFVARGGTLLYFPSRPPGALLEPLWQSEPPSTGVVNGTAEWSFGQGHVISSTDDFLSAGLIEGSVAAQTFAALLEHVGVHRLVEQSSTDRAASDLIVTELVPDEFGTSSDAPPVCAENQLCAAALVSITNMGDDLRILQSSSRSRIPGKVLPGGLRRKFQLKVPCRPTNHCCFRCTRRFVPPLRVTSTALTK